MRSTIYTFVITVLLLVFEPVYTQPMMEKSDRCLAAVKTCSGSFLIWGLFGNDREVINEYKGSTNFNSEVITNTTSCLVNSSGTGIYCIKPVIRGDKQQASPSTLVLSTKHLNIPISAPASMYSAGNASADNLDGGAEYESVLKRKQLNPSISNKKLSLKELHIKSNCQRKDFSEYDKSDQIVSSYQCVMF